MPLPEADVAHICRWVDALNAEMPDDVLSQLRYETETYRNAVTLVECRLVDLEKPGGDWFRVPFARLRFFRSSGWELFYADRNSKFHIYEFAAPTQNVKSLLREIHKIRHASSSGDADRPDLAHESGFAITPADCAAEICRTSLR